MSLFIKCCLPHPSPYMKWAQGLCLPFEREIYGHLRFLCHIIRPSQAILLPEQHMLTVKISNFMVTLDCPWTGRVRIPGPFPQISKGRNRPPLPRSCTLRAACCGKIGTWWRVLQVLKIDQLCHWTIATQPFHWLCWC